MTWHISNIKLYDRPQPVIVWEKCMYLALQVFRTRIFFRHAMFATKKTAGCVVGTIPWRGRGGVDVKPGYMDGEWGPRLQWNFWNFAGWWFLGQIICLKKSREAFDTKIFRAGVTEVSSNDKLNSGWTYYSLCRWKQLLWLAKKIRYLWCW